MFYKLKSEYELREIADGKSWVTRFRLSQAAKKLVRKTFIVEPEHIKPKIPGIRDFCGDDFYPAVYFNDKFDTLLTEPPEFHNWFIVPLKLFEPVYNYQQEFWAL